MFDFIWSTFVNNITIFRHKFEEINKNNKRETLSNIQFFIKQKERLAFIFSNFSKTD